jgi:hypothetical protein
MCVLFFDVVFFMQSVMLIVQVNVGSKCIFHVPTFIFHLT